MKPWLVVLGVCLVACGDDDSSSTDAGTEDAGVDAASDAGTEEDAGTDAGQPAAALCRPDVDPGPFPEPDAWKPAGWTVHAPQRAFTEEELGTHCAYLSGHEDDIQHHNLLVVYDGYLLMPWAPEWGDGGLTFWDATDPCAPVLRGVGRSETMRETHAIGFSPIGGSWAVVDSMTRPLFDGGGGIEFWDVSDTSAPEVVSTLSLPGFFYPDAYARVSLSVFWQAPYVYVGGADNGVYVVDATDPRDPKLVAQYVFDPILRVGQVQAIGNLLVATAAEGPRTVLLDVSNPLDPQPIGGGDFVIRDSEGEPRDAYFTNLVNGYVWYARKSSGAGLLVYDVRDPARPTYAGDLRSEGGGGYVFVKDDVAFEGAGRGGYAYDVSDPSNIREIATFSLVGDLDTVTPIGNVVVASVDADAQAGRGSVVIPYATEPDTRGPSVTWAYPPSGSTDLALTSRFGVGFSEMVEPKSAFEGSVRLYETASGARVAGTVSAQETLVSFHPNCPLQPGTSYTLEVMANGVTDFVGNPVAESTTYTFTTRE
ncbi:MAG: Ig-like domain-containing protein [Sandaracinus sp.]|nr:Ig-like domain-containing protein [Sandaracinus sp.]